MSERTKICYFCAETIKAEAKVCPICGRDLRSSPSFLSKLLGLGVVCLVAYSFFAIIAMAIGPFIPDSETLVSAEPKSIPPASATQAGDLPASSTLVAPLVQSNDSSITPKITLQRLQPGLKTTSYPIIIVKAENCNLRSGPGTNFVIVGSAKLGDTFRLYGQNEDGSWLKIDENSDVWVLATLVDMGDSVALLEITKAVSLEPAKAVTPKPEVVSGVSYYPIFARIYSGVKVYYGAGSNKTYKFEILGISDDCPTIPSGRGVYVRYPDGSDEWKDRRYLITTDLFFVRQDDPALDKLDMYVYNNCP